MIKMHYPAKGDLPKTSGKMRAQRKSVLAYTKSLGWTQAIRRQVGKKKKFEWVCSSYDGNTLFSDDKITAWTELPDPSAGAALAQPNHSIPQIPQSQALPQPEQLTEAKEIIKDLLDTQYQLDPYLDIFKARIERAEDFISGVRVTESQEGESMNEDLFELILQIGTYNGEVCYESFDDMEKDSGSMGCVSLSPAEVKRLVFAAYRMGIAGGRRNGEQP